MRLQSGLNIRHPIKELEEMTRRWFPVYDGVVVSQDNELRPIEIALSVMLSQISRNTAALIWEHRDEVERYLANISAQIDLIDVPADSEILGIGYIASAFESLCGLRRVKFGVAAKILHKKRPALIPIVDSRVYGLLPPACNPSLATRTVVGSTSRDTHSSVSPRYVKRGKRTARSEQSNRAKGTPLSQVRILDYFLWRAGRETVVL